MRKKTDRIKEITIDFRLDFEIILNNFIWTTTLDLVFL